MPLFVSEFYSRTICLFLLFLFGPDFLLFNYFLFRYYLLIRYKNPCKNLKTQISSPLLVLL